MRFSLERPVIAGAIILLGIPFLVQTFPASTLVGDWINFLIAVLALTGSLASLMHAYYSPIFGRVLQAIGIIGIFSGIASLTINSLTASYPFDTISFFAPYIQGFLLSFCVWFSGAIMADKSAQADNEPTLDLDGNERKKPSKF